MRLGHRVVNVTNAKEKKGDLDHGMATQVQVIFFTDTDVCVVYAQSKYTSVVTGRVWKIGDNGC